MSFDFDSEGGAMTNDRGGRVEGKVAFVTGAARGQGRSHAVRLAEEGADVIALDLCGQVGSVPYPMGTPAELAETVRLVEATGRRIVAGEVDVRDRPALRAALDESVAELGRLDIVVANAGIVSPALVEEISDEMWDDMIDINLTGVWNTARAAVPHLRKTGGGGAMVLTSSVAGLKGGPGIAHYIAAKHGVVGLMRALAMELAPESIRVNCVAPTQVNTVMLINEPMKHLFVPDKEEVTMEEFAAVSEAINALPVPWVEASDVSAAVLFLVSDEGRYITGTALPVDAGGTRK
jgi:(+)-trans-carveol dehydrogenase